MGKRDYTQLCNNVVELWNSDVPTKEIMSRLDLKYLSSVSDIVRHSRIQWVCPAKKRYSNPGPAVKGGYLSLVAAYYLRYFGVEYNTISWVLMKAGYPRTSGAIRTGIVARKNKPLKFKNSVVLYDRVNNEKDHNYISLPVERLEADISEEDPRLFAALKVYREAWTMLAQLKEGE